jgi:D-alanyl-D-alanine carboxypeptidase/D-alanyl-D-alanine-endopeptidase (penicillin-binding protein 4)
MSHFTLNRRRALAFGLRGLALFLGALAATSAVHAATPLPRPLQQALLAAGIPAANVAVLVQDTDRPHPSLSYNADVPMNPASTMKLVTSFAALELLGPTYSWKTEFFAAAPVLDGVLEGDLVIKGHGDPKMTIENFWLALRKLRALGVREIRGNLVLDRSWFEAVENDPTRFDNEPLRPYNVVPDALLVNFKAVRFQFVPNLQARSISVAYEPQMAQLEVAPHLRLTDGDCGDWRAGLKADFRGDGAAMRASFAGTYPASCGEKTWNVSLFSHADYIYGVFKQLWQELGGSIRGGVRDGIAPAGAQLLFATESPSLAEVVRDINKFSNNVMARQLFLTLSAQTLNQPGRNDRSFEVIQSWLAQRTLSLPGLVMENGSGLSRAERISAGGMARVLDAAFHSAVMPEFIASLPLVAFDGTMRRRLKSDGIAGRAHIKTGSLADVRSIAGYVLDRNGHRHMVVFFINHANANKGQAAQDALLKWVYEGAAAP